MEVTKMKKDLDLLVDTLADALGSLDDNDTDIGERSKAYLNVAVYPFFSRERKKAFKDLYLSSKKQIKIHEDIIEHKRLMRGLACYDAIGVYDDNQFDEQ